MKPLTGWMYTDTVNQVKCPKCGADTENDCVSAKGRKVWPPHQARLSELTAKVGLEPFKCKVNTASEILNGNA